MRVLCLTTLWAGAAALRPLAGRHTGGGSTPASRSTSLAHALRVRGGAGLLQTGWRLFSTSSSDKSTTEAIGGLGGQYDEELRLAVVLARRAGEAISAVIESKEKEVQLKDGAVDPVTQVSELVSVGWHDAQQCCPTPPPPPPPPPPRTLSADG